MGIYEADSWVNATHWVGYLQTRVIVFMENGLGYIMCYNSSIHEKSYSFEVFSWNADGNISKTSMADGPIASGGNGYSSTFKYENGILTEDLGNGEVVTYHHVDSFTPPYSHTKYDGVIDPDTWYLATFEDFQADYDGLLRRIKAFS